MNTNFLLADRFLSLAAIGYMLLMVVILLFALLVAKTSPKHPNKARP